MSRDLPASLEAKRSELRVADPWVWLFEFEVPTIPATRLRLAANPESVTFGADSDGAALVYSPYPIGVGLIRQSSEGDIPAVDITVGNPERMLSAYVEQYDGMIGQPVRVLLVNTADLGNPQAKLEDRGEIQVCTVGGEAVTVRVSTFSVYQRKFPPYRYVARTCRHQFGDAYCGYDIVSGATNVVGGGFNVCPKTLDACEVRGDDELARGEEVLHPARFGGWRGIPRQSGSV